MKKAWTMQSVSNRCDGDGQPVPASRPILAADGFSRLHGTGPGNARGAGSLPPVHRTHPRIPTAPVTVAQDDTLRQVVIVVQIGIQQLHDMLPIESGNDVKSCQNPPLANLLHPL